MYKLFYIIFIFSVFSSCSQSVVLCENRLENKLQSTHSLVVSSDKSIILDDFTASKSPYMQLYDDSLGVKMLTLLNPYNNSVYFFDYVSGAFIKKISYEKEGPNAILSIAGYYIKNMDSIYVYNRPLVEVVLTNAIGHVKKRLSLQGHGPDWAKSYPQYAFSTVCPILEIDDHLILTGLCPFSIENSAINKFKFTACIDLTDNKIDFHHTYPSEIYGNNANWEDPLFLQVYPTLSPTGDLIHSFAASHDLRITTWNSNVHRNVYGGSNVAGAISSIDWDFLSGRTPKELIYTHYLQQDLYAAILYDPWRKVYYRFLQQGIKEATTRTQLTEKPVIVIIMNEQFNYLGETLIGKGTEWNWSNSFVTKEGLNIEYVDSKDTDEKYMKFKIFTVKSK